MSAPGERGRVVGEPAVTDRVLTLPNVLSVLRLVGVPVFLWAILSEHDVLALVVLMLSGVSDYLDGKIARRFGMESRLGQLLDPFADRLYIATTLFGLAWRDIIPWWLVVALVGREVLLAGVLWWIKRYGQTGLPVHFVGKAATFNLLYAFPLLLLGEGSSTFAAWALPIGWAFAWWGTVLYWVAGVMYIVQARQVVAAHTVPAT
ncbi:CDP-alcohol phosphatidyltransferase family protein [Phycicoccus sp. Soil803]|uniref:CDP-alcohol phosphatidyltransferase family protein n=1 Tax=Phycicoccus sp. Soil803 TaxID=1736415 RepID=UPI000710DD37|nr:CDP-alcohol phosphatidyltransferase family protein [Phycicoccus sp. Soil803]KRF25016.1 CDP-diacylglycerol--glycerol-3-phosphate 3-phosphatidyltransferase [Phycicoccus sp. Soil803]